MRKLYLIGLISMIFCIVCFVFIHNVPITSAETITTKPADSVLPSTERLKEEVISWLHGTRGFVEEQAPELAADIIRRGTNTGIATIIIDFGWMLVFGIISIILARMFCTRMKRVRLWENQDEKINEKAHAGRMNMIDALREKGMYVDEPTFSFHGRMWAVFSFAFGFGLTAMILCCCGIGAIVDTLKISWGPRQYVIETVIQYIK